MEWTYAFQLSPHPLTESGMKSACVSGVPIIALLSTACGGKVSRIVPVLEPGAGVVTSRADVHYVVTEHGIAYLHGKTLRERTEALIGIADPRFRQELEDFAVRAHYLERKMAAYA